MSELQKLRLALEEKGFDLSYFTYSMWRVTELGKSYSPTIDQLDDLYCGFVSGVLYNLGSGKTPEIMEEIGPSASDRFSNDAYKKLWFALTGDLNSVSYGDWIKNNPESDAWILIIKEGLQLENEYLKDPETWLTAFRKKLMLKYE